MTDQTKPAPPNLSDLIRSVATRDRLRVAGGTSRDVSNALRTLADQDRPEEPGTTRIVRNEQPNVSDLLRTVARRDRLTVSPSATTTDVSAGLRLVRSDRDVGEPGSRRLVRTDKVTVSDLIRQLHDAAAGKDAPEPETPPLPWAPVSDLPDDENGAA